MLFHGKLLAVGTCKELARSVGGKERLRLSEKLRSLPGLSVETDGSWVTVVAPRVRSLLPAVIHAATEVRASLRDIETREPDLETVFLTYTGRALAGQGD